MEESERRKGEDRRKIRGDRRSHDLDEVYKRSVAKKIVVEKRKGDDRRKTKRRTEDQSRRFQKNQSKAENDWLESI